MAAAEEEGGVGSAEVQQSEPGTECQPFAGWRIEIGCRAFG